MRNIKEILSKALDIAQVLLVMIVFILCVYQVVGRYFFSAATGWTETANRYAFVWLIFLGAGLAALRGAHFEVEFRLVTRMISRRQLALFCALAYLVFGCVLIWAGWLQVVASHRFFHPEIGTRQSMLYLPAMLLGGILVLSGAFKFFDRPESCQDAPEE